jgi:hypothetical protein
MNESRFSPELKKQITREEVISAYKKFVEQGIKNPDSLDSENSEVKKANELFNEWQKQADKQAEGNKEAKQRANLAKTMLYVDAGFTDPIYLEDVYGFLDQDAENAEESDNPERKENLQQITEAMMKIRKILAEQKK